MPSPSQMTLLSGQRGHCPLLSNSRDFPNVCGPAWRVYGLRLRREGIVRETWVQLSSELL